MKKNYLLVEFNDIGMSYTTHYNIQKDHEGNLYSVGNSERGFGKENNFDYVTTPKEKLLEQGYVRACIKIC